jgi:hypothetical protein
MSIIIAKAGHVSPKMTRHYTRVGIAAQRRESDGAALNLPPVGEISNRGLFHRRAAVFCRSVLLCVLQYRLVASLGQLLSGNSVPPQLLPPAIRRANGHVIYVAGC